MGQKTKENVLQEELRRSVNLTNASESFFKRYKGHICIE